MTSFGPVDRRALRSVASLTRKGRTEEINAVEVAPAEAGPVLKRYVRDIRIVGPYFTVTPDAPVDDFVAEAGSHPVFQIEPKQ